MLDALTVYLDGEKSAGLFLAGIAAAALVAAVILFRTGPNLRSFALTVGILALPEIALGIGLYLRTGPQVSGLVQQLGRDAGAFRSAERVRMTRVQRNFVVIEYVELMSIIATALLAISQKARPGVSGVALGILINAAMLLAFDVIAERRGADYLAAIDRGQAK
jgi:hypothetical protein